MELRTRAELQAGLAELRDLARGIYPAILTQRGLAAAGASLAERAPLPTRSRSRRPPTSSSARR